MKRTSCIDGNEQSPPGGMLKEIRKAPCILERLRRKLVVVNPTTEDGEREKMALIVEHQSKFPMKLRRVVSEAAYEEEQPSVFLQRVYNAMALYFFGEPHHVEDGGNGAQTSTTLSLRWCGPDMTIDTEEEIELGIRFFPQVLNEQYTNDLLPRGRDEIPPSKRGCHPIYLAMTSSKAMSFVPLLAELGEELGRFSKKQRGGLGCSFRGVLFQLVNGTIRKDEFDGDDPYRKVDRVSTDIMIRLKEKGLMVREDIYSYNLVNLLLYQGIQNKKNVVEQRFRFLIDWDRYILLDCVRSTTLLDHFVRRLSVNVMLNNGEIPPHVLRIFRLIVEAGVFYFPDELGFIFHERNFKRACKSLGNEAVKIVIEDVISKTLNHKRNMLQEVVFSAASNDKVSLDGLYTLVRRDPVALLSKYTFDYPREEEKASMKLDVP